MGRLNIVDTWMEWLVKCQSNYFWWYIPPSWGSTGWFYCKYVIIGMIKKLKLILKRKVEIPLSVYITSEALNQFNCCFDTHAWLPSFSNIHF